jgi:hypothetical protein
MNDYVVVVTRHTTLKEIVEARHLGQEFLLADLPALLNLVRILTQAGQQVTFSLKEIEVEDDDRTRKTLMCDVLSSMGLDFPFMRGKPDPSIVTEIPSKSLEVPQ